MIRRMLSADAEAIRGFLDSTFKADPTVGDAVAPSKDFLATQTEKAPTWLSEEGGKVVGVLGPAWFGEHIIDGKARTFVYFDRLVVDYDVYLGSQAEAARIAGELTLTAADDIQAERPPDDIKVHGLKDSRGGHWCEVLGMKVIEENGPYCTWLLAFKDIWDSVKRMR